jgi:hypothetical protein
LAVSLVLFILIVIAATAPGFIRSDVFPNQQRAKAHLRSILAAQVSYYSGKGGYAKSILELSPYLEGNYSKVRDGYLFLLLGDGEVFSVYANPVGISDVGQEHYFMDETGAIRYRRDVRASVDDPRIND